MDFEGLFEEWQQKYTFLAFIKDGIVDDEKYGHPRILFILRDKNDNQPGDLRQSLRECGEGWRTWNNVARWTIALLDRQEEYPRYMPRERRIEQVRRIAVMNLKKESGGSRTDYKELENAVTEQHQLIQQEIRMCKPEVIITANAELLRQYVFPECSKDEYITSSVLGYAWSYFYTEVSGNKVPVVSFPHPQATVLGRYRGHELFELLYRDMGTVRTLFINSQDAKEDIK